MEQFWLLLEGTSAGQTASFNLAIVRANLGPPFRAMRASEKKVRKDKKKETP